MTELTAAAAGDLAVIRGNARLGQLSVDRPEPAPGSGGYSAQQTNTRSISSVTTSQTYCQYPVARRPPPTRVSGADVSAQVQTAVTGPRSRLSAAYAAA